MGNVRLYGSTSGYTELAAPAVAPDGVLTLPAVAGTLATTADVAAAGKILQVVSVFKADTFTTTSTSLIDVTGLTATITPSETSSKILVTVSISLQNSTIGGSSRGALIRGATQIGGGTGAGSRGSASFRSRVGVSGAGYGPATFVFLDDPATTAATTYKVQIATEGGTTGSVGLSNGSDSDNVNFPRLSSTITVMEIGA